MEPVGQQVPQANLLYDIAKNAELLLFWGCDQETTTWGWMGQLPSRLSYWFTELGIPQIYIAPDLNYAAAVHADKWIPILPNTDAALYLAVAREWFREGTYDKEYLATHTYGVAEFEAYVMGETDGLPKSPAWAAPITGVPACTIKALASDWAARRTTIAIGNGGPAIRGPYSTEPARLQVLCLAMQGLGKPGRNQAKMEDWGFMDDMAQVACPRPLRIPSVVAAHTGSTSNETNHAFVPKTLVPKAILEGECDWWGNEQEMSPRENQFVHYKFPGDDERPPVPGWIACGETHQETLGTERSAKYPLLVMSNHPRWKIHAQHDDITWLREIETCKVRGADGYQYQPVWLHPRDAAAQHIKTGDVVKVFNERGTVLGGAYVTERVIPGAVSMDHGARPTQSCPVHWIAAEISMPLSLATRPRGMRWEWLSAGYWPKWREPT